MNFDLDDKKLSYIFYGVGVLIIISLFLAIGGSGSFAAAVGIFLFRSFSFPAFYLPFFLIFYGYLISRSQLTTGRIILLTLTVIPFLTVSLIFRILFAYEGSELTISLLNSLGKFRSVFMLFLLTVFEIFLLYFLPKVFILSDHLDDDHDEDDREGEHEEEIQTEDDAFKEYAFRFPDPETGEFSKEPEESIEDIFTSILSGGAGSSPPQRPTEVEPVKEENPYDSLESPILESDPAIAVLTGVDENDPDEEFGVGEYTYHKQKDQVPFDEAEEKMSEIMTELDNVLSSVEESSSSEDTPFFNDPETYETGTLNTPAFEDQQDNENIESKVEDLSNDDEYSDQGYIEDHLDELDEFRTDISEKLAPLPSDEGGVLREVKVKKPYLKNYGVPVKGILAEYPDNKYSEIDDETRKAARVLEVTLEEFKISAKVTGIKKGPVITMFELLPAPGVKISKITNLADNIALRLAASSVRIVAPIPGKHAVGIEVPNKKRAVVPFGEMISAPEMKDQDMAVPIVLGKDIRGGTQVIDLTRTPHLLIAGATGSGKSVCVNSLICSILYERSPADVKMILVDPKIVELKLYNDIPHLLTPVITDPKKAIQAIQWCLYEMERRYSLLDTLGVREIRSYNKRVKERKLATTELPYLILVIDEFADLMATSGKELEAMIARLAAMSRAVGIHLVLATQRPSADVITGLIKANFPSRVAFMVASMMDSRIIIDSGGAEKLLGKGDMLFTSAWDPFPSRVQGAFLSEEEVERIVAYVKTLGAPEYIDDEIFIDDDEEAESSLLGGGSTDPLFNKALEIVASAGKASASYLQRRLKIGYNRAARLVEQMEDMGIVGPQNGSKPRDVIHMPDTTSNY